MFNSIVLVGLVCSVIVVQANQIKLSEEFPIDEEVRRITLDCTAEVESALKNISGIGNLRYVSYKKGSDESGSGINYLIKVKYDRNWEWCFVHLNIHREESKSKLLAIRSRASNDSIEFFEHSYLNCNQDGLSEKFKISDEVRKIVSDIDDKIKAFDGSIETIEPISYRSQVDQGINYFVKACAIHQDNKKTFIHLFISRSSKNSIQLRSMKPNLLEDEAIEYFNDD